MSTTIVAIGMQVGSWNPTTSVWTNGALTLLDQTTELWGTFNVLPVAGKFQVQTVTLRLSSFTPGDLIVDLLVYTLPRITDFVSGSGPSVRTIYADVGSVTLVAGFGDISLPLNFDEGHATVLPAGLNRGGPLDANGRNRFSVGLRITADSPTTSLPLSFIGQLTLICEPQFTGLSGPFNAHGRADECPKCGGKSTRDTWVRDGYTKLMVCPECYDDEDRVGQHYAGLGSERPGQGEG